MAAQTLPASGVPTRNAELPCLLVYSDIRHVPYINVLLDYAQSVLIEKGYRPVLLGDDIRSSKDYLATIDELVNNCVLGIIIVDGFRPNVLFEFGYLLGRNKPTIIIQSTKAQISIKTLFAENEDTGLTDAQFHKLKDPILRLATHLSDFAGKHILFVEPLVKRDALLHISQVLEKELDKRREEIIEQIQMLSLRGVSNESRDEVSHVLSQLITLYFDSQKLSLEDLDRMRQTLLTVSSQSQYDLPYAIYDMLAQSYVSKAEAFSPKQYERARRCMNTAMEIYELLIETTVHQKRSSLEYGDSKRKLAAIYAKIAGYENKRSMLDSAISDYLNSLSIYSQKEHPRQHLEIQIELGQAYTRLAEITNSVSNAKKAITVFQNVAKRIKAYNPLYPAIQVSLGIAYGILGGAVKRKKIYDKSIAAFQNALKVIGEHHPQYYVIQNNLGLVYKNLGLLSHDKSSKLKNYDRAINAFMAAIKITKSTDPVAYSLNLNNLGITYLHKAEIGHLIADCNKAIKAEKEAIKIRAQCNLPFDIAASRANLGSTYLALASFKNLAVNCKLAINTFEINKLFFDPEQYPYDSARSLYGMGLGYLLLSTKIDSIVNLGLALDSFNGVLTKITREECPNFYGAVLRNKEKADAMLMTTPRNISK